MLEMLRESNEHAKDMEKTERQRLTDKVFKLRQENYHKRN